ncbi:MAG: pentapeptide repeat-containing protein [Rhodococcus sp. (in: high G+C Gram-positive bacteria)]|nr:MAG: pentapeptide repeat-containing protein [Rhodococcus sp. (in: high G+C Gram-positive bacteria)]
MGSPYPPRRPVRPGSSSGSRRGRRRVAGRLSQPLPRSRVQRAMLRFRRALGQLFVWHGWPTVVSVATAVAAIAALFFTAQSLNANSNQYHLAQRGQVSERFAKAVEQLGSAQLEVRLGGIYSLEQLAVDSPQDHGTVFEVLAAFVRSHAPSDDPRCVPDPNNENRGVPSNSVDLQATLAVVGRRDTGHDRDRIDLTETCLIGANLYRANLTDANLYRAILSGAILGGANLSGTNLYGADLPDAFLVGADLVGAYLAGANLSGAGLGAANLSGADLYDANLTDANLPGTDLTGTDLTGATLTDADLTDATLTGATLTDADLTDTDLHGTNLSGANLTGALLRDIRYNHSTQWPAGFTPPPSR